MNLRIAAKLFLLCAPLVIGCGAQDAGRSITEENASSEDAAVPEASAGDAGGEQAADVPRRIIYRAEVELVVPDIEQGERELQQLVDQFAGYLADATVERSSHEVRRGRWVARIPSDRFSEFLASLDGLGVAERRSQTAEDVTAEYVDLEARIANKQHLEERVLKLLDEHGGKLSDVIEVERELARVREEIERMQGRLRYLGHVTALSTVEVGLRQEAHYLPPEQATLTARIGHTWSQSLLYLTRVGEVLTLLAVALLPWLLAMSPVALVIWYLIRRTRTAARPPGSLSV